VAFVPTMGNLHEGHLNLVKLAAERADHVIVSIFVNPLQFAAHEDLDKYPRTLEADLRSLAQIGNVSVFTPPAEEMYRHGEATRVVPEHVVGTSESTCRPHFFSGVATVCLKLFNIVRPDVVVFGEKDAMQCVVIRRMLDELELDIELVIGPTMREPNGVATSSRNSYLTPAMWERAPAIYKALNCAAAGLGENPAAVCSVRTAAKTELEAAGVTVEYVSIADANLQELTDGWTGGRTVLTAACRVHDQDKSVRLIDALHVDI